MNFRTIFSEVRSFPLDDKGDQAFALHFSATTESVSSSILRPKQVHGNRIVRTTELPADADGIWTDQRGETIGVVTADCVPVLLGVPELRVMAIHAGWRGLASNIIARGMAMLGDPAAIKAWIGPCISGVNYEVGDEVIAAIEASTPGATAYACHPASNLGKWQLDVGAVAVTQLVQAGLSPANIMWMRQDTFAGPWMSYRRSRQYNGNNVATISLR